MKYYTFKKFTKKSGHLVPISFKKDVPFTPKRIFLIYGKKNFLRGDHAHKKCSQFFLPISGKIELFFTDSNKSKNVILDSKKKKGILLEPLTWCKVTFKTKNAVMMVFCDREYEFNDYIEKYEDFIKIIKKKNK
jgi:UDP-2-acetamido-3-amino-2,3-dideoxy-glucuronate N-acetyltransferase